VTFHEVINGQWSTHPHVESASLVDLKVLAGQKNSDNLASLFPIYGWKKDEGTKNIQQWIEAAARQAGKQPTTSLRWI
jgi:hypothetical protein